MRMLVPLVTNKNTKETLHDLWKFMRKCLMESINEEKRVQKSGKRISVLVYRQKDKTNHYFIVVNMLLHDPE